MSSNLVILYPHYLLNGHPESWTTGASGYSEKNLVAGSRQARFRSSSNATAILFRVDISHLPEDQKQPNYIYLAGARLSSDRNEIAVNVNGFNTDAYSSSIAEMSDSSITSGADMVGKNQEDYILFNDALKPANFWEIYLSTGASAFTWEFRKIFLGQYFDFGTEPETPLFIDIEERDERHRQYPRTIRMRWRDVSNYKLKEFNKKIVAIQHLPICLATRTYHTILANERVIYCKLNSHTFERAGHNSNRVECEFKEVI